MNPDQQEPGSSSLKSALNKITATGTMIIGQMMKPDHHEPATG